MIKKRNKTIYIVYLSILGKNFIENEMMQAFSNKKYAISYIMKKYKNCSRKILTKSNYFVINDYGDTIRIKKIFLDNI